MDHEAALSATQADILSFFRDYAGRKARPPTYREIMAGCGLASTSVVNYHVGQLVRRGYVIRERAVSRGMRLTPRGEAAAGGARKVAPARPAVGVVVMRPAPKRKRRE